MSKIQSTEVLSAQIAREITSYLNTKYATLHETAIHGEEVMQRVAALIAADRRAVLEEAAERFRMAACPLAEAAKERRGAIVPTSCVTCQKETGGYGWGMPYCTEVEAILSDNP